MTANERAAEGILIMTHRDDNNFSLSATYHISHLSISTLLMHMPTTFKTNDKMY
jgi:hypothetical protein